MRSALCCLVLLMGVDAFAANGYWVSVASATDLDQAERLQKQAGEQMAQSFSLQPSTTEKGFYYRVVTGPFSSVDEAQSVVAKAVAAGFDQAWVLPDSAEVSTSVVSGPNLETQVPQDKLELSQPESQSLPDGVLPQNSLPAHTLVDTAPPGYKLNKLHRDDTSGG